MIKNQTNQCIILFTKKTNEVETINTKIIKPTDENLKQAGKIIASGGLVAFPTETVYGLGADAFNPESVKKIFEAKGRPSDNPLIVHISNKEMIDKLVIDKTDSAKLLIDTFMPGPITLVMKKSEKIDDIVSAGRPTVAVRFPENEVALSLIENAKTPIAAPSANLSGKPSPTEARHVIEDMDGRIDCIIDGEAGLAGVESTVVDVTEEIPVILRPGIITLEDIKEIIPETVVDEHVLKAVSVSETPKSPGMKYKHYAPDADVTVVEGAPENVYKKIQELLAQNPEKKCGVLTISGRNYNADYILSAGNNNIEYAHNLFTRLREFDEADVEIVFAELCIEDKFSMTVKNRLYKSAGNKVIYV